MELQHESPNQRLSILHRHDDCLRLLRLLAWGGAEMTAPLDPKYIPHHPPMIDVDAADYRLVVWYMYDVHMWRIRVSHASGLVGVSSIGAIHEPRFGIDAEDYDDITKEADRIVADLRSAQNP